MPLNMDTPTVRPPRARTMVVKPDPMDDRLGEAVKPDPMADSLGGLGYGQEDVMPPPGPGGPPPPGGASLWGGGAGPGVSVPQAPSASPALPPIVMPPWDGGGSDRPGPGAPPGPVTSPVTLPSAPGDRVSLPDSQPGGSPLTEAMDMYALEGLRNPSRFDIPLVQEGTELIDRELARGRLKATRNLDAESR